MTIRTSLLRAFLGLALAATVLIAALAFFEFKRTLEDEIADNLRFSASTVLQHIDTFLFSQLENLRVWRSLEIMQDIRVGDVDKRLAQFLSDLHSGQGSVFESLLCTDADGRIIAASNVAITGTMPQTAKRWHQVADHGKGEVEILIEPAHQHSDSSVLLRTSIPDLFGAGKLGYLYASLNWHEVLKLLDHAVENEPRSAILLDSSGNLLGASRDIREQLEANLLQLNQMRFSDWPMSETGSASYTHTGTALGFSTVLVGSAASSGYQHFTGLGWHALILEPTRAAFQPVWHLLWTLLALLLATLSFAAWISWRLAQRIAQPIVELTEFTRDFRTGHRSRPDSPHTSIAEVSELNQAFIDMIEALEQSREQIVRAGKLAVVGEMAAIMAHEVRTPLGILRTSAELLEKQPGLGERERELTGFITSETERLNRLVTLLLECARPRPPHFAAHDLHDIINNVTSLLKSKADNKGVNLHTELNAEHSVRSCDREQLTQVFLNLIINALDFVPTGGQIVVKTQDEAGELLVSVMDDGPGIAAESRPRIFDPFYSRREGGIGLGLTIVQQIVQVHQAQISVTESPWKGARFDIRFTLRELTNSDGA